MALVERFVVPVTLRCLVSIQVGLGVDVLEGEASFVDSHTVKYGFPGRTDIGGQVTAKNIIIATGSVPFVPPG